MYETPIMSLKQATFTPTQFQALQYTPQKEDSAILERSLANIETRHNNAIQQKGLIDKTLGDIESSLNESESEWFSNYKNDIRNQIQEQIDAGNYGDAYRLGQSLAGNVAQDTRIIGRIQANKDYNDYLNEIQKLHDTKVLGDDAYEYLLDKNKYYYEDIESNGRFYEGNRWTPTIKNIQEANIPQIAMTAFAMLSPEKSSVTKGSTSTGKADGSSSSSSSQTSDSYERKSFEDILAGMEHLIAQDPELLTQLQFSYDIAVHKYNKINEEIERLTAINPDDPQIAVLKSKQKVREEELFSNGTMMGFEDWMQKRVYDELLAKNLAYNWTTTSKITSSGNQAATITGGGEGGRGNGNYPFISLPTLPGGGNLNIRGPLVGLNGITLPTDAIKVPQLRISARFPATPPTDSE